MSICRYTSSPGKSLSLNTKIFKTRKTKRLFFFLGFTPALWFVRVGTLNYSQKANVHGAGIPHWNFKLCAHRTDFRARRRRVACQRQTNAQLLHFSTNTKKKGKDKLKTCCSDCPGNFLIAQSTHFSPSTYSAL